MIDLADMIHKERRDVYNAMQWSRLWKRVATKYYRKFIEDELFNDWIHARADANRRRSLLRECEWVDHHCPICGNNSFRGHAEDCELAKELGE